MSRMIYMFPGQGSQSPGMGKDLYEKEPTAKSIFEQASSVSGIDLIKLCFEGSEEELKQTQNTQPALFTCAFAAFSVLKEKGKLPEWVAGHSLGEYTAVAASGILDFEAAVKLVTARGRLMAGAGSTRPGSMAAVIGMADEDVVAMCEEFASEGIVVPANFNSPGQVVISGEKAAIQKAVEVAKEKGAKRAIELPVSGAFHSPLMEEAATEFRKELDATEFKTGDIPVISNVTAEPVTDGIIVRDLLHKQLMSPVRWTASIQKAVALGAQAAVEVGPGKVLSGLLRRINRDLESASIQNTEDIQTFTA